MRVPLHVTVDSLDDLAAVIEAVEDLGHPAECAAFAERERLRARDEYLRAAVALLMTGSTPWGACLKLAAEILKFESLAWPRLRDHDSPPEPCSTLRACLFRARRLGPLPATARQLRNIVAKWPRRCDFADEPFHSATCDAE